MKRIQTTDGPNGARGESYVSGIKAACFPCSTSLGATFDTDVLFQAGRQIALETKTKAANILLAPTVNVIRSPLGGRNYETYSEDPLVLGTLGAAFINGCQSEGIAATPKHFVANDAENERKTLSVQVDEQTLREIYLYPFQLIMKLSNPLCFMTSYNRVNGTYVADDRRLINEVLRNEWGFQGLVMSDWMGTYSTAESVNAGVDLEMPGPTKWRGQKLLKAIKEDRVLESTVNSSARRVLELLRKLNRFENPEEPPESEATNIERDTFICNAAAEGMVLLKNDRSVLPLPPNAKIAVIGHLAKVASLGGGGSARVDALHTVTPLKAFEDLQMMHTFEPGVPVFGALPHADPSIVSVSGRSNPPGQENRPVKLEWYNGSKIGAHLINEEMLPNAEYMIKEVWPEWLTTDYCTKITFDVTPLTTGEHTLSVISTGRATVYVDDQNVYDREQESHLVPESFYFFKSKIERRLTHHMNAGQTYTLSLESWAATPEALASAKGRVFQGSSLRFNEYVDVAGAISRAAAAAESSEYAIIFVGTTNEIESEGYDRDTMDLPGKQYDLVRAVAAKNPNTVVVNLSGAPVTMTPFIDLVPTIVQGWFPGQECGYSIVQILTGRTNPGGRLPMSWPKRLEDNPSYGNFPVDAQGMLRYEEGLSIGYRHYDREDAPDPLFPFGFGLSYTTFEISDARPSAPSMSLEANGSAEFSCVVTNTGDRFGKFVVQLYVQMPKPATGQARPVKELKAFSKVGLEKGQSKVVVMKLDRYSVSIYDGPAGVWVAQKGEYIALFGTSASDIVASVPFSVLEQFTWTGI